MLPLAAPAAAGLQLPRSAALPARRRAAAELQVLRSSTGGFLPSAARGIAVPGRLVAAEAVGDAEFLSWPRGQGHWAGFHRVGGVQVFLG